MIFGLTQAEARRRLDESGPNELPVSKPRSVLRLLGEVASEQTHRIAGRELVPDDIVLLAEGDRVPADMQLLESSNLAVDESLLTGESPQC